MTSNGNSIWIKTTFKVGKYRPKISCKSLKNRWAFYTDLDHIKETYENDNFLPALANAFICAGKSE
jgi:hypothetical protein